MIQELLGGAGLIGVVGERKISVANALEGSRPSPSPSPTTSPSPSPSSSTATTPTTSSAPADSQNINLRCPRCDSANTKFCYYNNYNLTQPRHFCKTCRRYWTKGGALRNVPIGGGCRKNKNITLTTSAGKSGRLKTCLSSEMVRSAAIGGGGGFEHQDLPSNPILWAQPHNSDLLSLLRANQNQNPNPNHNHNPSYGTGAVKEESVMIGSHMNTEASQLGLGMVGSNAGGGGGGGGGGGALGLNSFGHQAPNYMGMCSTSTPFWRSGSQRPKKQQQQQHGGFVLGEVQNTAGIQELYQRLRLSSSSSANYYNPEHSPVFLSNIINNGASSSSTTSAPSTILESAPVAVGEMAGYWNIPTLSSWTHDLQTTNGAYPN